jgi:chorismate dehydratase
LKANRRRYAVLEKFARFYNLRSIWSNSGRLCPVNKIRAGAVSYLNSKPLIESWSTFAPQADLTLDLPSHLADDLRRGNLDVALIPSVEYFAHAPYSILSDVCIACRGPVWSVKVVFRTAPQRVRTLALDEGSRTSAALARVLLQERLGIAPVLRPFPIDVAIESISADAIVVIGDRAMHLKPEYWTAVWDLGEEWICDTGLPFVFAMWVARNDMADDGLAVSLSAIRNHGLACAPAIAEREAMKYGLSPETVLKYFRQHLHFRLGEPELRGLAEFRRRAERLGLIPTVGKESNALQSPVSSTATSTTPTSVRRCATSARFIASQVMPKVTRCRAKCFCRRSRRRLSLEATKS